MDEPPRFTLKGKKKGSKKRRPLYHSIKHFSNLSPQNLCPSPENKCWGGWREIEQAFFCKNELLEGKGPSESLRGGVVSEPGRRRGSCGRETRDRGAWFPLGTPPGLQAPPLPKMYPSRPPAQALLPQERSRPPPAASFSLSPASRPAPRPDRPRLPPHPGAGNAAASTRGPAQAAPLVAASLPHPNRPRPSPQGPARGRAAATGLHNPAGDGGRGGRGPGAAAPPQGGKRGDAEGDPQPPGSAAPCAPRHSSPSALQWAGVGDRNRLPTWRTGSGPARRREHSSRAGFGGSGPGAPASGGAAGIDCEARCPKGASRGGNDPRVEGSQPPPPDGEPQGHRWAWGGG